MKRFFYIIPPLLLITVALVVFVLPIRMTVASTPGKVSIGLSSTRYYETPGVLSDWLIRCDPDATHIKNKYLKIRLDFYPSPESQCYKNHYVFNELTGQWQLNPALCHFVTVPYDISLSELDAYVKDKFNLGAVSTIDSIMAGEDSAHFISSYFSTFPDKVRATSEKIPPIDENILINQVKERLSTFNVTGDARIIELARPPPMSIDMGGDPDDWSTTLASGATGVDLTNPANATGEIDTVQVYGRSSAVQGLTAGSYYLDGGTGFYTCHDSEYCGNAAINDLTTFTGLTIAVTAGEFSGGYGTGGNIRREITGYGDVYYQVAERKDPGDALESASVLADDCLSLYQTGTEAGGTVSISNTPSSKAFGVIWPSSTYWSFTGNSTGFSGNLTDAEAYFTLTNDGDVTVDVSINCTNFTGGVGWALTHDSPSTDQVRLSVFKEGDGTGDNITLKTSPQAFISSLAASGNNTDWEFKLETGTAFTDGVAKSCTITLIASAS